jgi:hypothetical protein
VKRILVVAPIAVAAALIQAGTTAAAAEWCSDDPAIYLVDAAGNRHTVYLTTYGDGLEHKPQVTAQTYWYSLKTADGGHATKVKLHVFVPDARTHHFHVRSVVSTGPNGTGQVLAHHDGDSGHANGMDFELGS